jgi:hypothetical protein
MPAVSTTIAIRVFAALFINISYPLYRMTGVTYLRLGPTEGKI